MNHLLLQDIKTADWSQNVASFWPAVIRSALTWKGLTSLVRSGKLSFIPEISDSFSFESHLISSVQMTINYCENILVIRLRNLKIEEFSYIFLKHFHTFISNYR